ncbi:MAG: glycosyl hydrolase [Cyclobacteriaceae bacterium]|nr:glycosyl hydrolase [Cyclobacteriaceae bacterium]
MFYRLHLIISFLVLSTFTIAQSSQEGIKNSYEQRKKLASSSILKNYPVRNVGPVVQGGRVTDIAVNPNNSKEYYVAYASGGVFKTVNNGITFDPVFEDQDALGIGDIALAPSDPTIIYVGTGEKNSSRSSYAGSGVYKSTDGGATWSNIGLTGIHHTSRVIVHPTNPNTVWVASLGALYTHGKNRGVYKSTDGGKTWDKTLYVNDSTGIVDLVINPDNPDQLWAASWERTRKSWDFKGNGEGSAIYRSDDGGNTWAKKVNGFPQNAYVGRIGLDISISESNIIYALLDNQAETKKEKKEKEEGLKITDFLTMSKDALMALDNKQLNEFLKKERYPKKYSAEKIKKEVKQGLYNAKDIANYFGDANAALFETSVAGAQLYKSEDFGDNWKMVNSYDLEGVYYTYGYYFGEVRVNPTNSNQVYIFGVPLLKSDDGGVTFARIDTLHDVHVDHQTLWIDPVDSKHLLLGNDGGLYQSYDEGANWLHINNVSVGQFYTINIDNEKPYNIYGGLQDNGTLVGSSKSVPNKTKKWEKVFGGDGMFVAPDPTNSDIVYTGFQFGNYYRVKRSERDTKSITPAHNIGEASLRFNWRTPVVLSNHNPEIVYIGAQKLYRSLNRGDNWETISGDLTKNKPQGNVPFSTFTCIAESPLSFNLIYIGTDDGNIQVTKNGGGSWELITNGLPKDKWVSSVHPSNHDENVVYVTLNGYREDDFKTYVYKSEDQGKTWKSLKNNLPDVVMNVIVQDPVNAKLLYLGTDHGTYISFDDGKKWNLLNGLLNAASYDMKVHQRENELVIGTHGRSVFVVDVKPFQKLDVNASIIAYKPNNIRYSERWGQKRYPYLQSNDPSTEVMYYANSAGKVAVEIFKVEENKRELMLMSDIEAQLGYNTYSWNLKSKKYKKNKPLAGDAAYVEKGKYEIVLKKDGKESKVEMEVK